jgi:Xaa-Pro aminopeptidase
MKNARLEDSKRLLTITGCSHLLISDTIDVEYISGFKSSNAAVIISKRKNILLSDFRYKAAADLFCSSNPEWKFVQVKERFFDTIAKHVPEGSVLGYQSDFVTVDNFTELKKSLKKVKLKSVSKGISSLSLVKNDIELDLMRRAAGIGDSALKKLQSFIKPGVTEIEVARKLEMYCNELGSEKPSFDTIVLFGKRAALPHGKPQSISLKKGDWILIDFGCTVGGYCSDMTRTFVCGKASELQKKIYGIVYEAQVKARCAARAAISSKSLDSVARSYIQKEGYGKEFGHALGHGVGIRVHERPRVSPLVDEMLVENCVVTIEPGIYITEVGGVRIEDMMVLHKENGTELTNFPRELLEL